MWREKERGNAGNVFDDMLQRGTDDMLQRGTEGMGMKQWSGRGNGYETSMRSGGAGILWC